jgi:hypothetical protein
MNCLRISFTSTNPSLFEPEFAGEAEPTGLDHRQPIKTSDDENTKAARSTVLFRPVTSRSSGGASEAGSVNIRPANPKPTSVDSATYAMLESKFRTQKRRTAVTTADTTAPRSLRLLSFLEDYGIPGPSPEFLSKLDDDKLAYFCWVRWNRFALLSHHIQDCEDSVFNIR